MDATGAAFSAAAAGYAAFAAATWDCKASPADFGPLWLARGIRSVLKAAMGLVGVTWEARFTLTPEETRAALASLGSQGALGCVSPHGCYSVAGLMLGAPAFRCAPELMGLRVTFLAASVLFYVPVLREFLLLFGAREATKETAARLVGAGRIVALCPGGIWEQVHTDCEQEKVFVMARRGFIRLALELGVPLFPMYGFGEGQLFTTHRTFLSQRRWIARRLRVGLPWMSGRFGLGLGHCGPAIPWPTHVVHYLGRPISRPLSAASSPRVRQTGSSPAEAAEADVHAFYLAYVESMQELFNTHKDELLPPAVAANGLIIEWLGEPKK